MTEDTFDLDVIGAVVAELRFSWTFVVVLDMVGGRVAEAVLEAPFVVELRNDHFFVVTPGEWASAPVAELLSLLHRDVARVSSTTSGELVLRFTDGSQITGEPGGEFEAWQFSSALLNAYGLPAGHVVVRRE